MHGFSALEKKKRWKYFPRDEKPQVWISEDSLQMRRICFTKIVSDCKTLHLSSFTNLLWTYSELYFNDHLFKLQHDDGLHRILSIGLLTRKLTQWITYNWRGDPTEDSLSSLVVTLVKWSCTHIIIWCQWIAQATLTTKTLKSTFKPLKIPRALNHSYR